MQQRMTALQDALQELEAEAAEDTKETTRLEPQWKSVGGGFGPEIQWNDESKLGMFMGRIGDLSSKIR